MGDELKRHHSAETRRKISEAAKRRYANAPESFSKKNRRLLNMWQTMKQRCENPKREKYEAYGGRGISVCEEWHDSRKFVEWALSHGYKEGLQLDRIDNDGDYEPDNCRWVSPKENSRNRSNNKKLSLCGITKTIAEWCETIDISEYTLYWWLREYGEKECEKRVYKRLYESS